MVEDRGFRSMKVFLVMFLLLSGSLSISLLMVSNRPDTTAIRPLADIDREGNWTVTGSESYSDSTITLNGNLSITGTLVLDNTDLILNSSGFSVKTIKVGGGGTLTVRNGSSISGLNGDRYIFISDTGSNVLVAGSKISDCGIPSEDPYETGIFTRSTNFQILHSEIFNGENGVIGDYANIRIFGTNLTQMMGNGIRIMNGSDLKADILNITDCFRNGIDLQSSSMNLTAGIFEEVELSIWSLNSTSSITNSVLRGRGQHCLMINSSTVSMVNSHPSFTGLNHILVSVPAGSPSSLFMLNCSFANVDVFDPKGDVKEAYRFDVKVLTNGMIPAEDADIEIKDITRSLIYQGLTNDLGYIEDIPLAVALYNLTGKYPLTPHNFSIFYEGATRQRDVDVTSSHFMEMIIILTQPEVLIDYPDEGDWIPSSNFYLNGRVEDLRPISDIWMSIDGSREIRLPNVNPFSIPLELPDGGHKVRVVAMNDDGRFGHINISFGIDTNAPVISISSPSKKSYTNSSNVYIRGICSSDADLFVDGVEVSHPDEEFIASYLLKEGWNNILIKAVDRAGNTAEEVLKVYKDGTAPNIIIFSPSNGTKINRNEVTVHGSTDIDTQKLWINGEEVVLDIGEFENLVSGLKEGTNRISVVAQDMTGTRSTRYVTIIVDTEAPSVRVTEAPILTNQYTIRVIGVADQGSTVFVNNNMVITEDGAFSKSVELIEGNNSIAITAMDDLGNSKVIYWSVILDVEAPVFDLINPVSGSEFTNPILEILCRIFDENGIRSVKGRIGTGAFEEISTEDEFNWIVSLLEGDNIIDIEAEDEAGNVALKQLVYRYRPKVTGEDTEPPIVMITSPLMNETKEEGRIVIEGWAMDNKNIASVQVRVDDGDWMEVEGSATWTVSVDLEKGIYKVEARAVDNSGNEDIDRIWVTVFLSSADDDDTSSNGSSSLIITVVALLILLVVIVFGYLLYIRNRNLREELQTSRERSEVKERTVRQRPDRRTRSPSRERDPPGDR